MFKKTIDGWIANHQLIRFLIVGSSNALISYFVFIVYINFFDNEYRALIAQVLSYAAGMFWSFYWNRKWTFQSEGCAKRELGLFVGVQFFSLALSSFAVHVVVDIWGYHASISWMTIMLLITAFNFSINKMVVFK